jgi:hypothetical protein
MVDQDESDIYRRGEKAGVIGQRLAEHDAHFAKINGSIERLTGEMHTLVLAVQQLHSDAVSSAATVIVTAKALEDAEKARRSKSDSTWTPWARIMAVAGALAAAVGTYTAIRYG